MTVTKTPAASPLRSYIDEMDDLPIDILLGRIVLYTITDEPVAHADVERWFKEHALDLSLLPSPNKKTDAFKKATSDTKDSYAMPRNRTGNLLCREVSSDSNFIERHIVREVKDSQRKVLSYETVIVCRFYRPTDTVNQAGERLSIVIQKQALEAGELEIVRLVAQQINVRYQRYFDLLDGQKMRATVRNYLKRLNAIEVKGGVYFVHASRDDELGRLAAVVGKFGGGCHMNMIPIVDLQQQREFIVRVFEREASQALREITTEAEGLLSGRKSVTSAALSKIQARYNDVMANAEEHMLNLQINQDSTAASAEVAFNALAKLKERMLGE